MIKLSKFCILLLYRLLLARMYFKSCMWVLHSCAASGENGRRSCDSEAKSGIHLPSLRCPALRSLAQNWSFWLHLQPLQGSRLLPGVTHLGLTWPWGSNGAARGPTDTAPVQRGGGSSSRSQGDLTDAPGLITFT